MGFKKLNGVGQAGVILNYIVNAFLIVGAGAVLFTSLVFGAASSASVADGAGTFFMIVYLGLGLSLLILSIISIIFTTMFSKSGGSDHRIKAGVVGLFCGLIGGILILCAKK